MNSTLATDLTEKPAAHPLLETWGKNERMRHVPSIEWIIEKLDRDLRRRTNVLATTATNNAIDAELKALVRAVDRLADMAKHARAPAQAPTEIASRVDFAITHATSCLN